VDTAAIQRTYFHGKKYKEKWTRYDCRLEKDKPHAKCASGGKLESGSKDVEP